jgi:hypothetical protein
MIPKLGKNAIFVDVEALRRGKRTPIDLTRAPSARKEALPENMEEIEAEPADPLAAIVALARRRTRR